MHRLINAIHRGKKNFLKTRNNGSEELAKKTNILYENRLKKRSECPSKGQNSRVPRPKRPSFTR
jgi:hypothetical protein